MRVCRGRRSWCHQDRSLIASLCKLPIHDQFVTFHGWLDVHFGESSLKDCSLNLNPSTKPQGATLWAGSEWYEAGFCSKHTNSNIRRTKVIWAIKQPYRRVNQHTSWREETEETAKKMTRSIMSDLKTRFLKLMTLTFVFSFHISGIALWILYHSSLDLNNTKPHFSKHNNFRWIRYWLNPALLLVDIVEPWC